MIAAAAPSPLRGRFPYLLQQWRGCPDNPPAREGESPGTMREAVDGGDLDSVDGGPWCDNGARRPSRWRAGRTVVNIVDLLALLTAWG